MRRRPTGARDPIADDREADGPAGDQDEPVGRDPVGHPSQRTGDDGHGEEHAHPVRGAWRGAGVQRPPAAGQAGGRHARSRSATASRRSSRTAPRRRASMARSYRPSGSARRPRWWCGEEPLERIADRGGLRIADDPPVEPGQDLARIAWRQHRDDGPVEADRVIQLRADELLHPRAGTEQRQRGVSRGQPAQRVGAGEERRERHDGPEVRTGEPRGRDGLARVRGRADELDPQPRGGLGPTVQQGRDPVEERGELARPVERARIDEAAHLVGRRAGRAAGTAARSGRSRSR